MISEADETYNIHRDIANINNTLCWQEDEILKLREIVKNQQNKIFQMQSARGTIVNSLEVNVAILEEVLLEKDEEIKKFKSDIAVLNSTLSDFIITTSSQFKILQNQERELEKLRANVGDKVYIEVDGETVCLNRGDSCSIKTVPKEVKIQFKIS